MKNKKVKLFKIYSVIVFLIIIIFFLLGSVFKYTYVYWETRNKYVLIEEKIKYEEIKKKKIELEKEKIKYSTEIDKNILENNMLKKPGEKVIQLIK